VLLSWDDKSAEALVPASLEEHRGSAHHRLIEGTGITADGEGVVSHAGLVLLRQLADKTGLTGDCRRRWPLSG